LGRGLSRTSTDTISVQPYQVKYISAKAFKYSMPHMYGLLRHKTKGREETQTAEAELTLRF
ncbi:MAG: hypothetical protein ACO2PM_03290, partial [Pyrobaculum sp.]